MDRNKLVQKKPLLGRRALPPPGDIIPLGAKTRPGSTSESTDPRSLGSGSSLSERKRELPMGGVPIAPKKTKLISPTSLTPLGKSVDTVRPSSSNVATKPDIKTIDVPSNELVERVIEADNNEDDDRIDGILCGALKKLKNNRAKPDPAIYFSLMYLAKVKPLLFESEDVVQCTCNLLKRDIGISFKSKGNPLVSVLACNLLFHAFLYDDNWHEIFVKVYLEDAMGERVWIDHPQCRDFCNNIQTAFGTKMAPRHLMTPLEQIRQSVTYGEGSSPSRDDSEGGAESTPYHSIDEGDLGSDQPGEAVSARYSLLKDSIEVYVVDFIKDHLTRRQGMDTPRNLLRVLTVTCGFPEVRQMAATRLEMWLQNPKLTRPAQELLMSVCLNCDTHGQEDVEVIGQLIRVRLKTKPLINHYLLSMRELLNQHTENLNTVLKHTIYNELSNARNPNNMALLAAIFQHSPETAAKYLAVVFQELLMNRDDYLRAVRALFREIVKSLRYDMDFPAFCRGLMTEKTDKQFSEMEVQFKDRMLMSLTDLIALAALLSVTPSVREAVAAYTRGDRKDMDILRSFQTQACVMQRDAIWWLHTVIPNMFSVNQQEFTQCVHKVLFMENADAYCSKDNWPPESDRGLLLSLLSEVPVQEDTLMRILVIGLSKELPLTAGESLDLADKLVKRAAVLYAEDFPVLEVTRSSQLMDAVLNLCAYHHPENITLPQGYQPPNLAISSLYWKSWVLLAIISAFNPSNIGSIAWEQYPMLRCFMEMVMTNNFKFPPPTMASDEDMKNRELQIIQLEKQGILEFENHLAKKQITEGNSLLLAQVMHMDPKGIARRPPSQVLEQLTNLNKVLGLGHMLCRSRSPDFLLDIIQRQGTSQSMPWLAELVNSAEGSLDVLPVQCLCEFLLHDNQEFTFGASQSDEGKRKQKIHKQEQLLSRLQTLVWGDDAQPQVTCEVLDYFLRRLSSQQPSSGQLAAKGLSMVLTKPTEDDDELSDQDDDSMDTDETHSLLCASLLASHRWLLKAMPSLPHFDAVRGAATSALRGACQVETDPRALSAYVVFLSLHAPVSDLNDLAVDLAQLIVERPTIVGCVLPRESYSEMADMTLAAMIRLFSRHLQKALKTQDEGYSWSDTQDQIFLHWASGESAQMHILVVHAMVILLTYGEPRVESDFSILLNAWFPENSPPPSAYLVDTSEEALLLPDWLKLRMIRSNVSSLVDAALQDLEPAQLVLFIQSFGIPVASMSKLLAHLDAAVQQEPQAMEQAVVDKGYMAQLVEVQQMRGATGGKEFHKLLTQEEEDVKEIPKIKDDVEMKTEELVKKDGSLVKKEPDADVDWQAVIKKVFETGPTSQLENGQAFRQLQQQMLTDIQKLRKTQGSHPGKFNDILSALSSIISTMGIDKFGAALMAYQQFAVPLFSILLAREDILKKSHRPSDGNLLNIVNALIGSMATHTGQLVSTLHRCQQSLSSTQTTAPVEKNLGELSNPGTAKEKRRELIKQVVREVKKTNVKEADLENACRELLANDSDQLEYLLDACMTRQCTAAGSSRTGEAKLRIQMMTRLLHHQQQDPQHVSHVKKEDVKKEDEPKQLPSSKRLLSSTAGLLIDWLALLDPEVTQACPDLQQEVMFASAMSSSSRDKMAECSESKRPGSAYLLALLTHQASWYTLHRCIDQLLGRNRVDKRLNATAVLDFLWACIHIPKIWQGRDAKASKRHSEENILCLTPDQLCAVADYIVNEAESEQQKEVKVEGSYATIEARLSLLLNCCHGNTVGLDQLVRYMNKCGSNTESARSPMYQQLLLELYLQVPESIQSIPGGSLAIQPNVSSNVPSSVDGLSHRLLSVLADCKVGNDNRQRVDDANVACRKLAAAHPVVMIRQLSMIGVLLQGRIHLNFREFKARGHLGFFHHILGIFDLLEPTLFDQDSQSLHAVLEAYFQLLQRYGAPKRFLDTLVKKFIKLLYRYTCHSPTKAQPLMQQYASVLSSLTQVHPDLLQLKSLLAGITLTGTSKDQSGASMKAAPIATSTMDDIPGVGSREDTYSPVPGSLPSDTTWEPEDIVPYAERLSKESDLEEIANTLSDLEETSFKNPDILQHFVTELSRLLTSPHKDCRQQAFTLVIRYIRHDPSVASKFLPAYLDTLNSDVQEVIQTALKNLPEFTLLCQEHAELILQRAFSVGVNSKLDSVPLIAETMQLLSMDSSTTAAAATSK
ncbi:integrator complex subunit 1-like isoform X2 [Amphiura filiformis]|uniref:integrator complex subunit 1-like isoform X2 n=1 Tax=Amphiura filiformis TaxID=82378 RepID=UPI003B20E10B